MRTTLVLNVKEDLAKFIQNQPEFTDPSALINALIHKDMARQGVRPDPKALRATRDDVSVALEEHLDENTHAAG